MAKPVPGVSANLQGVAFGGGASFKAEKAHFAARKRVRRTAKMK